VRQKQPREYLAATSAAQRTTERRLVPDDELPFEFALNALRLKSPFTAALFESSTGLPIATIQRTLDVAQQRKLLVEVARGEWRPTDLGQRFLNDLQTLFLTSEMRLQ
jgi:oxygen-independent coproporphyrinogen-3 oxidase